MPAKNSRPFSIRASANNGWRKLKLGESKISRLAVVVIPLLFETQAESHFDKIICVACSAAVQRERLLARGWTPEANRTAHRRPNAGGAKNRPRRFCRFGPMATWTLLPGRLTGFWLASTAPFRADNEMLIHRLRKKYHGKKDFHEELEIFLMKHGYDHQPEILDRISSVPARLCILLGRFALPNQSSASSASRLHPTKPPRSPRTTNTGSNGGRSARQAKERRGRRH